MTIKGKILSSAAIPMAGLAVFTAVVFLTLSHIGKVVDNTTNETFMPIVQEDVPALIKLDESVRLLLNADRDAYQSHLAENELKSSQSVEHVSAMKGDYAENLEQVAERVSLAAAHFDASMKALHTEYSQTYDSWKRASGTIVDQSVELTANSAQQQADFAVVLQRFGAMREYLNQAGDTLKDEIDAATADTDPSRIRALENSYGLILNADRDLYQAYAAQLNLLRERQADALNGHAIDYAENAQQVKDRLEEAKAVFNETVLGYYSSFLKEFEAWDTYGQRVVSISLKNSELEASRQQNDVKSVEAFSAMRDTLDRMGQALDAQIAAMAEQMNSKGETAGQEAASLTQLMGSVKVYAIGFVVVIAVLVSGVLMLVIRSIVKALRQVIGSLTEGADQVASASGQVSAASQSLAQGATEQAAGLEETSSSLEEMSSMTRQAADNAQQANTLATDARKAAEGGAASMQRMIEAINEIQKSSDETAKILKVIDEIAFQTNLLALNAAVEAARAGEAGKGFAVVAEEVRNLAMRSAEAAKNTANMIEESVKNSRNGVTISEEVHKALDEIVSGISKTTDLMGEIAAASQEQAQGIDQVNTAVAQMDKVTQQNAANAEESASASEELSAQASAMNAIVRELAFLVEGGSAAQRISGQATAKRDHRKPVLKDADQVFHQIAQVKPSVHESAKVSIPMDDDFDSFNG